MRTMNSFPVLHTMVKDARIGSPHEARHLLLNFMDGPSVAVLNKLAGVNHDEIATGTPYQMEEKANSVMQEWAAEGFRYQREREPVYEDLKTTVNLALLMGYQVIYDPEQRDVRRGNLTGAVHLAVW